MHDADATLYRRWLASRDAGAFAALARRHAGLVTDVARHACGGLAQAEDALQDALLALARDGTERPALVGVRAWLARAAILGARKRAASDRARSRRERRAGSARREATMGEPRGDLRAEVRAALARVKGEDAAILVLRFLHGLDYAELAAVFDVRASAARVRVHRALRRVRRAAGRPPLAKLDGAALGALLGALPPAGIEAGAVDGAIAGALAAGAAAAGAGTAAATGGLLGVLTFGRVLVLAAIVGVGVGVALLGGSGHEAGRPAPPEASSARGSPTPAARLAGHATPAPDAGSSGSAGPRSVAPVPSKGTSPPRPVVASANPPDRAPLPPPTDVRLDLVHPDGSTEEIEISRVMRWLSGGALLSGSAIHEDPGLFRPAAGEVVWFETSDPRAALSRVRLRVPESRASTLAARVPEQGDPRLARLVLEVVDLPSQEPIADARLEWGDETRGPALTHADAAGRIVVDPRRLFGDGPVDEPALVRFEETTAYVHAPGHYGRETSSLAHGRADDAGAAELEGWLETGVRTIALPRLPDVPGLRERALRLLDAEGRPATDTSVFVTCAVSGDLRIGFPREAMFGFRRPDAEGIVRFPVYRVAGLEARVGGVPVASWGLAAGGWPKEGPRTLRMPPIADLDLVVEELPEDASGWWCQDALGMKRTPFDGCVVPRDVEPEAARVLRERHLVIPSALRAAGGALARPRATIRLPLAVRKEARIHLGLSSGERRVWTFTPDRAGRVERVARWEDLPEDP